MPVARHAIHTLSPEFQPVALSGIELTATSTTSRHQASLYGMDASSLHIQQRGCVHTSSSAAILCKSHTSRTGSYHYRCRCHTTHMLPFGISLRSTSVYPCRTAMSDIDWTVLRPSRSSLARMCVLSNCTQTLCVSSCLGSGGLGLSMAHLSITFGLVRPVVGQVRPIDRYPPAWAENEARPILPQFAVGGGGRRNRELFEDALG